MDVAPAQEQARASTEPNEVVGGAAQEPNEPVEDAVPDPDQPPPCCAQPQRTIRDYFRWRPVPWWIVFLGGIFLLAKLQLVYNDSPCAVLGTQSPVGVADAKKAFRTLSMCTHPDRLRGRLQRTPTPAELRRGEILFNRASAAKDDLTKGVKGKKKVLCYQGELELAVLAIIAQIGRTITSLGISDYFSMAYDGVWRLVTFQAGFFNTIISALWLSTIFGLLRQFLKYLWGMGVIRGVLAVVTAVIIGPVPTLVHFLVLPVTRPIIFLRELLASFKKLKVEDDSTSPSSQENSDDAGREKSEVLAGMKPRDKERPSAATIRQRKKPETEESKEAKNKQLLNGSADIPVVSNDPSFGAGPMPESIFRCVAWAHREPIKARQIAAAAVQFDLLLILTKPVIPLFMLLATGQVWNGLFSSLFIGHALRRWVPQMSYEAQHLLCAFFGVVHTVLGVSAGQVEDYANQEGRTVLHLLWSWSFKDILAVMHMCLLGSTVTAVAALGNEPTYASSFAAGIAIRIAIAQDSVSGLGPVKSAASWFSESLRHLGVKLDAAEEVVAYSGHGIGDCGGGPFRMLFGDGPQARWAAFALKAWLMLLPVLATMQWLQRSINASRNLRKRWKLTRFVQRVIMTLLGMVQCFLIWSFELNASNGALGNFWIAMLFGCAAESLLSTYDIRGPIRQIFFLLLFLLI